MYENVIADLMSIDGIRFVVLADNEGNIVEFESPYLEIKEVESLTAFFTDFFNRGSDVIAKASDDEVISILVECRNEKVLIANVNENLILILGAEPRTNIGLMRIESKKAVEKIQMMG